MPTFKSPPPSPVRDSHHEQASKVPEIIQYFVKGEFQPPRITYTVPTGGPPPNEGRSTNDAHHYASSSPPHPYHQHNGQHQPRQSCVPQSVPSELLNVAGIKAEAGKEQVLGAPAGVPPVQHEEIVHREHKEQEEQKPDPPPMEPAWDAQR